MPSPCIPIGHGNHADFTPSPTVENGCHGRRWENRTSAERYWRAAAYYVQETVRFKLTGFTLTIIISSSKHGDTPATIPALNLMPLWQPGRVHGSERFSHDGGKARSHDIEPAMYLEAKWVSAAIKISTACRIKVHEISPRLQRMSWLLVKLALQEC